MTTKPESARTRAYWFVGLTSDSNAKISRFLSEGIWQNQYHDFPFDNQGQRVSVTAIKAIGTVKKESW